MSTAWQAKVEGEGDEGVDGCDEVGAYHVPLIVYYTYCTVLGAVPRTTRLLGVPLTYPAGALVVQASWQGSSSPRRATPRPKIKTALSDYNTLLRSQR